MKLSEMIAQAGIVGCGGAGFPTHAKYDSSDIETIIINGAECEPLLQTDRYLMRSFAQDLVETAEFLRRETGAADCVIALKETYTREIQALTEAIQSRGAQVRLHLLQSFFPAGDEQTIVYEVTGRIVPPGGIPLQVGCVVSNVGTLHCIAGARKGEAFTQKYLTVTGEVRRPVIARVPLGTPITRCLEMAGGITAADYVVINGGPMMGKLMTKEEAAQACVTKTMSGLIVLPAQGSLAVRMQVPWEGMVNRAKSACIQCSFCTQMCPRALLGHPLEPHRIMRKLAMGTDIHTLLEDPDIQKAALCCSCGVCEVYACPMGLQPRTVNTRIKGELARNGIRWKPPMQQWEASAMRPMRKAPTQRIAARAGVGAYEKIEINELVVQEPEETSWVRLKLAQGIGAPAQLTAEDGARVKKGDLIAVPAQGKLGSVLHASIDGVIRTEDGAVVIQQFS